MHSKILYQMKAHMYFSLENTSYTELVLWRWNYVLEQRTVEASTCIVTSMLSLWRLDKLRVGVLRINPSALDPQDDKISCEATQH